LETPASDYNGPARSQGLMQAAGARIQIETNRFAIDNLALPVAFNLHDIG